PEDLALPGTHIGRHAVEHCRAEVTAVERAPYEPLGALIGRLVDPLPDARASVFVDQGPHVGVLPCRVANLEPSDRCDEALGEIVVDAPVDEHPLNGDAGLAGEAVPA